MITEIAPLGASVIAAEADTEKEFIAILRGADRKRVTEVRIYCSRSLFSAYTRGQNKIWDWLESGGAADASVRYSAERRVIYVIDIKWK